jgi:hypothetical protein
MVSIKAPGKQLLRSAARIVFAAAPSAGLSLAVTACGERNRAYAFFAVLVIGCPARA